MDRYGKIAVLAGGPSNERKISLKSGEAVYRALKRKHLDAVFFDVHTDDPGELRAVSADVAFIALHGRFGEDGLVQKAMETMGIPYTGSGADASRLALDKVASREIFRKGGLKVPKYITVERGAGIPDVAGAFGFPLVVKPRREGSSIGLSVVNEKNGIKAALDTALTYDRTAIVEEYIHGREITVGILEEKALAPIEVIAKHSVYDFNAKYIDEETEYVIPAELEAGIYRDVQSCALKAHTLLGCRDFSRVDMRVDANGSAYVLEINTIPGLTERSLLPKAASQAGIGFDDLCLRLVSLAHRRGVYAKEKCKKKQNRKE